MSTNLMNALFTNSAFVELTIRIKPKWIKQASCY